MSTISQQTVAVTGDTITAGIWNNEFANIIDDYNGNITNANISATAAIVATKISFSTSHWTRGVLSLSTGDLTTGTGKDEFTIPATVPSSKWVIESVEMEVDTAPTSGKTLTLDLNKNGSSILSGSISIADSAILSTGNTPTDTALSAGDRITIDIDTATSGIASTRVRMNIIIKQYIQTA